MSNPLNDGGPAFPCDPAKQFPGMSLRDFFAGQALAGLYGSIQGKLRDRPLDLLADAELTYRIADAMLKAREVQP